MWISFTIHHRGRHKWMFTSLEIFNYSQCVQQIYFFMYHCIESVPEEHLNQKCICKQQNEFGKIKYLWSEGDLKCPSDRPN